MTNPAFAADNETAARLTRAADLAAELMTLHQQQFDRPTEIDNNDTIYDSARALRAVMGQIEPLPPSPVFTWWVHVQEVNNDLDAVLLYSELAASLREARRQMGA